MESLRIRFQKKKVCGLRAWEWRAHMHILFKKKNHTSARFTF
jgi:hypothetical protein